MNLPLNSLEGHVAYERGMRLMDAAKVLKIAMKKGDRPIVYDDFYKLRPSGKAGGHYLHQIKQILVTNGWTVHESQRRKEWNKCGFKRSKTHFHLHT